MRYYQVPQRPRHASVHRRTPLRQKKSRFAWSISVPKFNLREVVHYFEQKPFIAQIVGISIITLAIILSFQTLTDFSSTNASSNFTAQEQEVRILSNFNEKISDGRVVKTVIEEIPNTKPTVEVKKEEVKPIQPQTYTVSEGDTLSAIAAKFSVTTKELVEKNGIENPLLIRLGDVLTIPN